MRTENQVYRAEMETGIFVQGLTRLMFFGLKCVSGSLSVSVSQSHCVSLSICQSLSLSVLADVCQSICQSMSFSVC